ncbi:MAG: sodium:solute symporter family protein [Salinivirgaceae bacterium]|nr:sodium:solute symporter family protein [Salinivirgaceae bacterium]
MNWIDLTIFIVYMLLMLGVGVFFLRKNKSADDYYVGGRSMSKWHIGLSVVATDVGGGFSIGLGGLGFVLGLSGSWMLFTGLIGAWLAGTFLIPKVYPLAKSKGFLTFPQLLNHHFGPTAAFIAGLISAIGYLGFTSSQLLAGAKLASATFVNLGMNEALIIMGFIAVVYTFMGGLKAVIYTDTIQWIILLAGLIGIGIPLGYSYLGGWDAIVAALPASFFQFNNLTWQQVVKWLVTIIPIWFVGMTLYQRIYASKSAKEAQKAWYIAGVFEYPLMAFMGVIIGLFARIAFLNNDFEALGFPADGAIDEEMGLPLFLRTILPPGLMGIMMAAYFSAIMSTADSCLMASSGNIITDLLKLPSQASKKYLRIGQGITLFIGVLAVLLALQMENVLELMLYSYAFMVSGLFVPVIAIFFMKKKSPTAAIASMIIGGGTTLVLIFGNFPLPLNLDPNLFGITAAFVTYFAVEPFTGVSKNYSS